MDFMPGRSFQEKLDGALIIMAAEGEASKVAGLLSRGARVNARNEQGYTPLLAAAYCGHPEVCEVLLKKGKANVKETTDGFTPLLAAAQCGHTKVCELLLANGSDLKEKSPITLYTVLHEAAGRGHDSLLQLLLAHKAVDVNSRERGDGTPLHCASQEGHLASVVALLQAGADPMLPQDDGALPIHLAAGDNHHEVVKILIKQGGCSPDQVGHISLQLNLPNHLKPFVYHPHSKIQPYPTYSLWCYTRLAS